MFFRKAVAFSFLTVACVVGASFNRLTAESAASSDITVPGATAGPIGQVPTDSGSSASTNAVTAPAEPQVALPAVAPDTGATAPAAVPASSTDQFWTGGKLPFRVSVKLGEIYDDNIFIQPDKTSDFITELTIKGELKMGDQYTADGNYLDAFYAPSGSIYADHSSEDYINQDVELFYQHRFSRLVLSLDQGYAKTTETSISIGNLVTSEVFKTNLKADYAYSDKLDLNSSFTQDFVDYDTQNFTSSKEWALDNYFLYKWDSKLSVGFGPKFGLITFAGDPLQTYQQLLPRLEYDYSEKLTFNLAGGLEYRQYHQTGRGDLLTGIFDITGTYHPWLDTTLSLTGSRHYVPAYGFIDQDYLATRVGVEGRQKFLKNFSLNLGFGYENDSYLLTDTQYPGTDREDNYYYTSAGLDWSPNTWLLVSGAYRYQKDSSNFQAFSFDDNQLELSVEASY